MKTPKAILFDLGDTVLKEECFNPAAGTAKLLSSASFPSDTTKETMLELAQKFAEKLNEDLMPRKSSSLLEISWQSYNRLIFDRLGVKLSKSMAESETDFWQASVIMTPSPGITQVLETLSTYKIPSAIVSNSVYSSTTLTWELENHNLSNKFKFVMSSTDYGVRKPHPAFFLTAIAKLEIPVQDIWFVGDSLPNDVAGSSNVGMTSIWYNPSKMPLDSDIRPKIEINHWNEFCEILKECL